MKLILSESRFDFKYENIFSRLDNLEIVEGPALKLTKILAKKKSIYHIRYIPYRGKVMTTMRVLAVYLASKFSNSKIVWTCHNIYEHNIPSKKYNDFIRSIICYIANDIIVFHKDLIPHLPKFARRKIAVASFGEFKSFVENKTIENPKFQSQYNQWLKERNIKYPDIISISAAKRNKLEDLFNALKNTSINTLVIAPKRAINNSFLEEDNFCIYNEDFVDKEVKDILNTQEQTIGFIGHENISVPTSIYMYASYGIPVIGLNYSPVNTIIKEYKIGEIVESLEDLPKVFKKIKSNYPSYKENCKNFLQENSWEQSAIVHQKIFK